MEFVDGVIRKPVPPVAAAERVRGALDDAVEGGYYQHAWYGYMARWDIEALLEYVEVASGKRKS